MLCLHFSLLAGNHRCGSCPNRRRAWCKLCECTGGAVRELRGGTLEAQGNTLRYPNSRWELNNHRYLVVGLAMPAAQTSKLIISLSLPLLTLPPLSFSACLCLCVSVSRVSRDVTDIVAPGIVVVVVAGFKPSPSTLRRRVDQ